MPSETGLPHHRQISLMQSSWTKLSKSISDHVCAKKARAGKPEDDEAEGGRTERERTDSANRRVVMRSRTNIIN